MAIHLLPLDTPLLLGLALALGAADIPHWSPAETKLAQQASPPAPKLVRAFRDAIRAGHDPLGDAFCQLRPPTERRLLGATYTPPALVEAMVGWAASKKEPARIVDPGAGSGRFLVHAGRRFPSAKLVGIEIDPLASLLLRAHLATAKMAPRASVLARDYRILRLPREPRSTLFMGNPPYVRHHDIEARHKDWLFETAKRLGLSASKLAGLHVHFFLATAKHARAGDFGAFVTAAEWLDVNYGSLVRELLLHHLGGTSLHLLEPKALPFADAQTTAAIACFEVGDAHGAMKMRKVASVKALGTLDAGRKVSRERLAEMSRWSAFTRKVTTRPRGYVELGELCHVHRGQVTGANRVWIAAADGAGVPKRWLFPTVTKARELFAAGERLVEASKLRSVIDLPIDLDCLEPDERKAVERFLQWAKTMGAHEGFVAQYRKAWWSVGLRAPAPILATYMARRPPAFVRNLAGARHINIAHGIYPREPMPEALLDALARHLNASANEANGRIYAGGLVKFEPKEMARLLVPGPDLLLRASGERRRE